MSEHRRRWRPFGKKADRAGSRRDVVLAQRGEFLLSAHRSHSFQRFGCGWPPENDGLLCRRRWNVRQLQPWEGMPAVVPHCGGLRLDRGLPQNRRIFASPQSQCGGGGAPTIRKRNAIPSPASWEGLFVYHLGGISTSPSHQYVENTPGDGARKRGRWSMIWSFF